MRLSYTKFLGRKLEMLYFLLDFAKGLTKDALVDSRAYIRAISQNELDRMKQQASARIFEMNDPPPVFGFTQQMAS